MRNLNVTQEELYQIFTRLTGKTDLDEIHKEICKHTYDELEAYIARDPASSIQEL